MLTIYHNPRCSKSRQTLALIEAAGVTAEIILYLQDPPTAKALAELLAKLNMSPRDLMRKGEADYKDNDLNNPELTDKELINYMVNYPKLIERPIVVSGDQAVLGRPPENVNALLP